MLSDASLDLLFRQARSHNGWQDRAVPDETLHALYDLVKWGPTSANCLPMRVVFVRSAQGREKLRPLLSPGNVDKTLSAPITAVIGYDTEFHRHLPRLFPHRPELNMGFEGREHAAHAQVTAFRNASLQAGYFIMAARALGLDCGPLSGFDAPGMDVAFWSGTAVRTNLLCNLGYGDSSKLFDRHPRLSFDEVCRLL